MLIITARCAAQYSIRKNALIISAHNFQVIEQVDMSEERLPSKEDYSKVIQFLPIFYSTREGQQEPIAIWKGGQRLQDGSIQMPYPVYSSKVEEFVEAIGKESFLDHDYLKNKPESMLRDSSLIANASLSQIKSILTYIVRGERFCDGHWESMIKSGEVKLVLERIEILSKDPAHVALQKGFK